eukprot:gene16742-21362_t
MSDTMEEGVKKGDAVPIDGVMAIVGEKGEDYKALLEEGGGNGSSNGKAEAPKEEAKPEAPVETATPTAEKAPAAPAAKAAEKINAAV